jgi:hypothetical protein
MLLTMHLLPQRPNVCTVHLWYVNHKVLSHTDGASTHKKALHGFVKAVGIPAANVAAPLEPAAGQVGPLLRFCRGHGEKLGQAVRVGLRLHGGQPADCLRLVN